MPDIFMWIIIAAVAAAVLAVVAIYGRAYLSGTPVSAVFFKPKVAPRVYVVEHTALDSKRRLVLIRRDDVDHLIMTGGPVDVVIESGIIAPVRDTVVEPREAALRPELRDVGLPPEPREATVFSREPRTLGMVAAADDGDLLLKR